MHVKMWRMFGLLGLAALALGAQEMPPALPGNTFGASVDVRVVNVEAVVTDAQGNRVRGLSAADLKLEVDGREVPIEYFSETEDGRPVPAPSAASPAAEGAAAAAEAAASPAPQGRSLLVFIDEAFAVAKQRDTVLQAIERDLKLLRPEDRMAIVAFGRTTIGGRLAVLSGWTGDRGALAAALKAARERPASGNDVLATRRSQADEAYLAGVVSANSDPYSGDFARVPRLNPASLFAPDAGDARLSSWLDKLTRAVVAAMNGMAPPSGRRTLLLLSGGWPSPASHIPLAIAANRLGYTVYPVDVAGIDTAVVVNDASLPIPSSTDGFSNGFISSPWEREAQDGMEFLATVTGGRASLNSARLTALERVVEDTSSYYWLGFTPQWKGDDRHHRIEVKVPKGLKVRSRKGFSDFSRATEASLATQGLLMLGGDPKDKRLLVETGPPRTKGSRLDLLMTVAIPVADLTPIEQEGGWVVEATLSTAAVDKTGSFSDLVETPLRLTLAEKPAPGTLVRYSLDLKLRHARQRLVATVRDPLGGATLWGDVEVGP
jgi:VWFA-related protein